MPYLKVDEKHDADESSKLCELIVKNEDGTEEEKPAHCILERGNPAPLQTGVSTPANCRTTDMRGKTREAGGQCDRGAYETQINTAMPDIGNNTSRRSRTALLNVLRNDIPGDNMWIRSGTLESIELKIVPGDEKDEHAQALKKHFGDKNEKLSKFLEQGKTKGKLVVVKAEVAGADLGLGEDPVPQYYDDITIINADGREDEQSANRAFETKFQCAGEDRDKDEECLIFYEAPQNYLCSDLPFEDYFAYSVEAWKYDSTKPLDKDELPEFGEDQVAEETFTGYVQVTIDNIPPIVPREGIKYRIDPGGKITIDLKDNGVKPIEGGVDDERPIKIENLTLEKEPQFALYNRRTHEVLGTGLFLDKENLTVTYHHGDVTKTFADTFSVKVTDSCGASSIVPIRIEFHGADDEGGSAPWALTLLLVVGGAIRRKWATAKAA